MALLLALMLSQVPKTQFCESFNKGWRAGFCAHAPACIAPMPPPCPPPEAGRDHEEDGWLTGYRRGFRDREESILKRRTP
jgi:hypothetical protein